MNLQQLEYALMLEKQGSFTKAAQSLNMTQPALSLQIKNLENEIGIALFDRSKGKIVPTDLGLKFLLKAGEIVMAGKQLKEYAYSLGEVHQGVLRLGIIPTLSPFLVPLFAESFLKKYPNLHMEINEMLTEEILQQIRLGELDGGIISTPVQRQGIVTIPLFYESFYFYRHDKTYKSNETLKVSNIDLSDLWLLEEGNCFRDQINDICSLKEMKTARLNYRCSSIDSLIRMVDSQGGSTILPELTTLSLDAAQEQHLAPIEDKVREVGFITRKLTGKEHLIEILTDSIKQNIPAPMKDKGDKEVVDPAIPPNW